MKERERRTVEKFKKLLAKKMEIHEILVFGSRARGDDTEESDLDVFIVVKELDYETEKYISDCAWESGFPEDIVLIPVAISIDDKENSPLRESVFLNAVYRDGIAV